MQRGELFPEDEGLGVDVWPHGQHLEDGFWSTFVSMVATLPVKEQKYNSD